jgi:GT2 family glycosyltransferase
MDMPETKVLDLSIIIPFKDKAKMTLECIDTLVKYNPPIYEILLVSNNSSDAELEKIRAGIEYHPNIKLVIYDHLFNYQKMNNWAVKKSSGTYILFLNNDTEFTENSKGLLEKMYKKAHEPDIGMVGCLLLYGDQKTIQHAGVYIRPGILGDHMYIGQLLRKVIDPNNSDKYPYDVRESRAMTAVTGAVQMIERRKFEKVKGFDERFIIAGGDVDLCLRLNKAGFQTWFLADGTKYIVHKESQSRAFKPVPYIDFYYSYKSYITGYDLERGDPFLPKITEHMR